MMVESRWGHRPAASWVDPAEPRRAGDGFQGDVIRL